MDGLADTLSPVDLPEPAAPLPRPLAWTTTIITLATFVLALLNAHAIRGWAYQLPPNAATARVVTAAESWYDAADRLWLNRPVETMHGWWQAAREARFQRPPISSSRRGATNSQLVAIRSPTWSQSTSAPSSRIPTQPDGAR